ncbi:MAG TPA: high frequency lysogenization protein HflD [Gammaproteobacteria bacterium]|nr:high frequency lysogenization protein HflD [Gammaproteobacteria bacterium]
MGNKINDVTIALAGIAQAVALMKQLAQTGKTNETAFSTSIYSIFQTTPSNAAAAFGEIAGIQLGLQSLIDAINSKPDAFRPTITYMLSLMRIQKKISRSPRVLDALTKRILKVKKQVDYFSLTHPTVISNLGDAYIHAISSFRFRLLIAGNPRVLGAAEPMEKIRALLLAAIRSSVLWRQMGGSRLQLLFFRKKIKHAAEKMLAEVGNNAVE